MNSMTRQLLGFILVAAFVPLASCGLIGEGEKDRAEITAALQKYLNERSGLNLAAMDWKITELNTDRDNATVQVSFTTKQGNASMVMQYQMKRENNVWTVRKSGLRGSEGMPAHPGTQGNPTTPPPETGTGELPAGHPPINTEPKAPAKTPPAPKKSS